MCWHLNSWLSIAWHKNISACKITTNFNALFFFALIWPFTQVMSLTRVTPWWQETGKERGKFMENDCSQMGAYPIRLSSHYSCEKVRSTAVRCVPANKHFVVTLKFVDSLNCKSLPFRLMVFFDKSIDFPFAHLLNWSKKQRETFHFTLTTFPFHVIDRALCNSHHSG